MTIELNNKYPISEIFVSPQGEGIYSGVAMCFVRLAGCTVGKPYPKERYVEKWSRIHEDCEPRPLHLPIYTEKCTLYDGRTFACDTDYRVKERLTSYQILMEIPKDVKHVCLTGGEPLMHKLDVLLSYLKDAGKVIHMETSGTISAYVGNDIWLTVSPKFNPYLSMIKRADEIKLLVDDKFSPTAPIMCIDDGLVQAVYPVKLAAEKTVFLQPVNMENAVDRNNLKLCLAYQNEYPNFRISPQMHKLFTEWTGELVR